MLGLACGFVAIDDTARFGKADDGDAGWEQAGEVDRELFVSDDEQGRD